MNDIVEVFMAKNHKATHWLMIKHKDCGAAFTIEKNTFPRSFDGTPRGAFRCPNCGEVVVNYTSLDGFFEFLKHYQGERKVFDTFAIKGIKVK